MSGKMSRNAVEMKNIIHFTPLNVEVDGQTFICSYTPVFTSGLRSGIMVQGTTIVYTILCKYLDSTS